MATDPKTLFLSLAAGDMLMVPVKSPLMAMDETFFVTVLRVDQGDIFLSKLSDNRPVSVANALCNPFRFSDSKNALIDRDGDVPRWYTIDISLERGGAQKAAAEYAQVPRAEHLRYRLTEAEMNAFKSDPRFPLIAGIVQNGEAGNQADQMSLVLDLMGIVYTKEALAGVTWHLLRSQAKFDVQIALISLDLGTAGDSAASDLPKH